MVKRECSQNALRVFPCCGLRGSLGAQASFQVPLRAKNLLAQKYVKNSGGLHRRGPGTPGTPDARDARDARDSKDARDARDARDAKDARHARDAKDAKDARDARDARDVGQCLAALHGAILQKFPFPCVFVVSLYLPRMFTSACQTDDILVETHLIQVQQVIPLRDSREFRTNTVVRTMRF